MSVVPHFSLNNPQLPGIAVKFWIPIAVCFQVTSYICGREFQESASVSHKVSPSEGSDPVPFTIFPDIFSIFVCMLSGGRFLEGRVVCWVVVSMNGPTLASQ